MVANETLMRITINAVDSDVYIKMKMVCVGHNNDGYTNLMVMINPWTMHIIMKMIKETYQ